MEFPDVSPAPPRPSKTLKGVVLRPTPERGGNCSRPARHAHASAVAGQYGIANVVSPDGWDELRRDGERLTAQGQQDRLECPDPAPSRRFDDRAHVGMELRTPDRAEAVGDFAKDRTPSQCLLGPVVGGRDIRLGEEDEQLVLPPACPA